MATAPEEFHEALSGSSVAQIWLANCYDKGSSCVGVKPDSAMACAWRGVRLASRSAELSLADTEAFRATCSPSDESSRQRAAIALIDLTSRIYGRASGALVTTATDADVQSALYPAINTVRTRINLSLAQGGSPERLPPFGPARPGASDGVIAWSTCSATICLDGSSPAFGGGVIGYRVTVRPTAAASPPPVAVANRLAAAGLDAPSVADLLAGSQTPEFAQGPVCWSKGRADGGAAYAGASRAPCLGR